MDLVTLAAIAFAAVTSAIVLAFLAAGHLALRYPLAAYVVACIVFPPLLIALPFYLFVQRHPPEEPEHVDVIDVTSDQDE